MHALLHALLQRHELRKREVLTPPPARGGLCLAVACCMLWCMLCCSASLLEEASVFPPATGMLTLKPMIQISWFRLKTCNFFFVRTVRRQPDFGPTRPRDPCAASALVLVKQVKQVLALASPRSRAAGGGWCSLSTCMRKNEHTPALWSASLACNRPHALGA